MAASLEQPSVQTASVAEAPYRISGKPYAFLIAFVSAVGGFLFGYDLAIMGGANVYLREQFGLSPAVFGFTSASAGLGCIVGPFFGGWFCDRIGRRNTLIGRLFPAGRGLALHRHSQRHDYLQRLPHRGRHGRRPLLHRFAHVHQRDRARPAGGAGWGSCTSWPSSSARSWRCWWPGCLASWLAPEISWRWMFGSELVFVAIFAFLLFLVPESPRWLAERDNRRRPEAIFTRIDGPEFADTEMAADPEVARRGVGLAGTNCLRRGCGWPWSSGSAWRCSTIPPAGAAWAAIWPTFRSGPAFPRSDAIFQFLLAYGFMGLMTLLACGVVDRAGRRPLWIVSSLVMIGANGLLGPVFHCNVTGILVLVAVFLCAIPHSFALGPLPWLMMSEIFPTRIRARAVAITTTFIWASRLSGTATCFP